MAKTNKVKVPKTPSDIGKHYSRDDLGVKGTQNSEITASVNGEKYLFVTINKRQNELHRDGVVYQTLEKDVVDYKQANDKLKGSHIMVRFSEKGDRLYEYIGDEVYICRYDHQRKKIFVV